jgi:hypothetical protein
MIEPDTFLDAAALLGSRALTAIGRAAGRPWA